MEGSAKGTVTPLSSLFAAEEAQKAAKRVYDTIVEKQQQLDRLRGFVSDNANLISTVPFGKAAFFPGRLIHTNEFLVLLGEGYYADRTSKQTVDILRRRGNTLESQIESLRAMVQDLKLEASFFDRTASEAEEGILEIREDYVEESSVEGESEPAFRTVDEAIPSKPELRKPMDQTQNTRAVIKAANLDNDKQQYDQPELPCTGLAVQPVPKDGSSHGDTSDRYVKKSTETTLMPPQANNSLQAFSSPINETLVETPKPKFDSRKAFTGSIVERADNLNTSSKNQTPSQVIYLFFKTGFKIQDAEKISNHGDAWHNWMKKCQISQL
ncbi:hypothetical protein F8388_015565 [Cannabis sativa]|uniref:Uncharacterized protein n=1 Tax=Cannabis sativa TaxID=3483 RepID=A0A7J6GU57_CANSA|nr:hypothetical protein F8388_015565 [Cannabis sativa]KAF4386482.1 hypothetical protein G4B88_006738 [Cannabis sativa]